MVSSETIIVSQFKSHIYYIIYHRILQGKFLLEPIKCLTLADTNYTFLIHNYLTNVLLEKNLLRLKEKVSRKKQPGYFYEKKISRLKIRKVINLTYHCNFCSFIPDRLSLQQ